LSNLSTSREHEDLLQKTARLTEELVEQLIKKTGFQLPKDIFERIKIHREEYTQEGGFSL